MREGGYRRRERGGGERTSYRRIGTEGERFEGKGDINFYKYI